MSKRGSQLDKIAIEAQKEVRALLAHRVEKLPEKEAIPIILSVLLNSIISMLSIEARYDDYLFVEKQRQLIITELSNIDLTKEKHHA